MGLALGLASLWAARAGAQSLEHPTGQDDEEQEVAVHAPASERTDERAFRAPEAITIQREGDIRKFAPMSLADAMRTTPSTSVQQTTPGQGTVYVRGLSGRAVVYAVDGVRLNTAFFRAGNNDHLGLIDPFALADMTVIPGATSVEYGSDALGGAVLMSTTTPQYRTGPAATIVRALQTLSSNPVGTASRVAVMHEARDWGIHGGFTYYQAGAIRPGEGLRSPDPRSYAGLEREAGGVYLPRTSTSQPGTEFETYAGDVTYRRRLGSGTHLVARGQISVRPELVRYDQVTPRFKRDEPQRAEAGLMPMSRQMASLTLDHHMTDSLFDSARAVVAWQQIAERRYQRSYAEHCLDGDVASPAPDGGCPGRVRLVPEMDRTTENNASNTLSTRAEARSTGNVGSLILGLDARHDRIDSSGQDEDLLLHTTAPRDPRYPDGSSLSEGGLFAHARFEPVARVHVFAGARAGAFLLDVPGRGGPDSRDVTRTLLDGAGSLGAHWEFARNLAWTANAARGVRSPNVEDLAALGTRAQGRFQIPNPDLGPEHSYTVDTGIKVFRKNARIQSFVFYTRYDDAIILAPTTRDGAAATPDGDAYYHSTNASSVDLYGLDASFDVELAPPIATFARALAMRGTQKNRPGSDLPETTPADRVPPVQGELGLRFTPVPRLRAELWVQSRAAQRRLNDPVNLDDNRIPANGTPAWTTYHARLSYLTDSLVARLTFDNFTDRLVLEHGSGFHRPGFAVTGGVELRFDATAR